MQAHIFVARFSDRNYNLIREQFRKKSFKSSTFNKLRTLSEEQTHEILLAFRESGWSREAIDEEADRKKTPTVSIESHHLKTISYSIS